MEHHSPLLRNWPQANQIIIVLALVLGCGLRFLWPADMEWKSEEQWMFQEAQRIAQNHLPLPAGGIMSSIGIPNPGLGLWFFVGVAHFASDPVAMVQWVQGINVAVLGLWWGFCYWQITAPHRQVWLWGLAIASVNPFAIVFSRKIWIPDLLAPFCFFVFVGHWFRHRFWGALLWGAASLGSAQIHMGGFFLTLGLCLWTIWSDAQHQRLRKVSWIGYGIGLALASVPLGFWLVEAIPQWQGSHASIVSVLVPKFYLQWLTSGLGINLSYSLKSIFWSQFLREPLIGSFPTYLIAIAHMFLTAVGVVAIWNWVRTHRAWRNWLRGQADSPLDRYLKGLGLGVGGLFTFSATNVVPYYIPIVFPFQFLWIAKLYAPKQTLLIGIIAAQFCISLIFLCFIHHTGGFEYPQSDYGRTYWAQQHLHHQ